MPVKIDSIALGKWTGPAGTGGKSSAEDGRAYSRFKGGIQAHPNFRAAFFPNAGGGGGPGTGWRRSADKL